MGQCGLTSYVLGQFLFKMKLRKGALLATNTTCSSTRRIGSNKAPHSDVIVPISYTVRIPWFYPFDSQSILCALSPWSYQCPGSAV